MYLIQGTNLIQKNQGTNYDLMLLGNDKKVGT